MAASVQNTKVLVTTELHGCGVYLANERLTCTIVFANLGTTPETIAWAGAQIHCQACVREDIVKLDSLQLSARSHTSTETAFVPNRGKLIPGSVDVLLILELLGERGSTIRSTPTTILFCNLVLNPGEVKNG
jgi:hypothetical protein